MKEKIFCGNASLIRNIHIKEKLFSLDMSKQDVEILWWLIGNGAPWDSYDDIFKWFSEFRSREMANAAMAFMKKVDALMLEASLYDSEGGIL